MLKPGTMFVAKISPATDRYVAYTTIKGTDLYTAQLLVVFAHIFTLNFPVHERYLTSMGIVDVILDNITIHIKN